MDIDHTNKILPGTKVHFLWKDKWWAGIFQQFCIGFSDYYEDRIHCVIMVPESGRFFSTPVNWVDFECKQFLG